PPQQPPIWLVACGRPFARRSQSPADRPARPSAITNRRFGVAFDMVCISRIFAPALVVGLAACAPAAAAPPVGQYGCATAPAVLAGSGAYGAMLHQLGQWEGDIWILDAQRYAGP